MMKQKVYTTWGAKFHDSYCTFHGDSTQYRDEEMIAERYRRSAITKILARCPQLLPRLWISKH